MTNEQHLEPINIQSLGSSSSSCSSSSSTSCSSASSSSSSASNSLNLNQTNSSSPNCYSLDTTNRHINNHINPHHHHIQSNNNYHHLNSSNNGIVCKKSDEHVYNDLNLVMGDLKQICSTLSFLARQIDQIVDKIDNKFGYLMNDPNGNNFDSFDKSNLKNIKNFTKIINSNLNNYCNYCTANSSNIQSPTNSNTCNSCTTNKNKPAANYGTNGSNSSSNSSNKMNNCSKNENYLTNIINSSNNNQKANFYDSSNLITSNPKVVRTQSDRKVPTKMNSQDPSDSDVILNENNNNLNNNNNNSTSSKFNLWNTLCNNQVSTFNNEKTNSLRTKCTRSKSQPAFKDTATLTTSNTNSNLNKFSILEANRLTSSPICNFNTSNITPLTNNTILNSSNNYNNNNNEAVSNMTVSNLLNDSSNGESSFYEDQLDNELESFSNTNTTIGETNFSQLKTTPSSIVKKDEQSNAKLNPNGIQKSIQNSKPKSSNSNHHVSFNINNAIYTSKQDTPIPISILKQPNLNKQANSINSGDLPLTTGISNSSGSSSSSPLQSSLKKSPGVNNLINAQLASDKDNKNSNINNTTKSVRIDTKTTIL